MAEYTPDRPLVIEGIIEDGEFRQTNGQSFIHWIAAHDRAVKAEALREAAGQIRHRQHAESVRQMLNARADRIEGATERRNPTPTHE